MTPIGVFHAEKIANAVLTYVFTVALSASLLFQSIQLLREKKNDIHNRKYSNIIYKGPD